MAIDEITLIKRAQKGDARAFEELVSLHDRNVLSIALKYFNNQDIADDVYQEVFLRVYKSIKSFKFQSSFSTWLYRITINICITMSSKANKHKTEDIVTKFSDDDTAEEYLPGNELSPDEHLLNTERSAAINKALDTLSPKQKSCFILKFFEGYKIKEIADMFNAQEGTIKRYLFDAQNKMRDLLKIYAEEA